MPKYIFVTGGVISSLGKGIASASIAKLLEIKKLKVTLLKFDPYINVDPGTMNPYQHGEVYVTDDGAETDLDLGHYERFTSITTSQLNNVTSGRVYYNVIMKERKGDFLGGTIQVVPHITNEIKESIKRLARQKKWDVVIVEVGGTVGDIESLPFLEAIRQLKQEVGRKNAINIHLTLVPYIKAAQEIKTKPTQHSVGKLREIGIQPDILLCRTEKSLSRKIKEKIALFCNVDVNAVIQAKDVRDIYEVPLMFIEQKLDKIIVSMLELKSKNDNNSIKKWKQDVVRKAINPKYEVSIGVVGKYIELQDAYKSIYEALRHGGIANDARVHVKKIDAEKIEKFGVEKFLKKVDGILIPGGFGKRGIEGKIKAVEYARENKIPFLGICLGMQTAVIEFARNVCKYRRADSTEFSKDSPYPVICLLEEQKNIKKMGGTMRLGAYPCHIKKGTLAWKAYKTEIIYERHRHRYEFNNKFRKDMEKKGLIVSGIYQKQNLVEIIEIKGHPWFIACQFHPEFKSKPDICHPLFRDFIKFSLERKIKG
jgi:CTP synthase